MTIDFADNIYESERQTIKTFIKGILFENLSEMKILTEHFCRNRDFEINLNDGNEILVTK